MSKFIIGYLIIGAIVATWIIFAMFQTGRAKEIIESNNDKIKTFGLPEKVACFVLFYILMTAVWPMLFTFKKGE